MGRTILTVSQLLRWKADARRSKVALHGAGVAGILVVEVMVGSQPPSLCQTASGPRALQQLAPLQGNAVVWGSEVRRPGKDDWPTHYSVSDAEIPQSQTLVAWRGGRGSSVTLILGGGSDTIHWMEVWIKRKKGWTNRRQVRDGDGKGNVCVCGCVKERRNKRK